VIGAIFKLYPDMLADPFSAHIPRSVPNDRTGVEVGRVQQGHPARPVANVRGPSEPAAGVGRLHAQRSRRRGSDARAADALDRGRVVKPIFSREGASVDIVTGDLTLGQSGRIVAEDRTYEVHPKIVQAYTPLPEMGGMFPVLGAWMVGDACAGLGVREDASRITQNLSGFKPHFVRV
jgi:hypothetical protein